MIYLVGSLRHDNVPQVAKILRAEGYTVFDDWHACGPNADDEWRRYETARGRSYKEALTGEFAENAYDFDKRHLDVCSAGVLVLPAGRSAHAELGYLAGQGVPTFVLLEQEEPERWDLMYLLFDRVCGSVEELIEALSDNLYYHKEIKLS